MPLVHSSVWCIVNLMSVNNCLTIILFLYKTPLGHYPSLFQLDSNLHLDAGKLATFKLETILIFILHSFILSCSLPTLIHILSPRSHSNVETKFHVCIPYNEES